MRSVKSEHSIKQEVKVTDYAVPEEHKTEHTNSYTLAFSSLHRDCEDEKYIVKAEDQRKCEKNEFDFQADLLSNLTNVELHKPTRGGPRNIFCGLDDEDDPNNFVSKEEHGNQAFECESKTVTGVPTPIDYINTQKREEKPINIKVKQEIEDSVPISFCSIIQHSSVSKLSNEEDFEKIKALRNPKMKVKKDLEISLNTVYDRLKPYGFDGRNIDLDPELQSMTVSRQFMSSVYGGSPQEVFPNIGKEQFEKHGIDNFMYLNAELHPYAPQLPGRNGLWFVLDKEHNASVYRLFIRLEPSKWLYVGMYVQKAAPPLSTEEWLELSQRTRRAWVKLFLVKPWAETLRNRIFERKRIQHENRRAELENGGAPEDVPPLTEQDILVALNDGEEHLRVIVIICVGYSEDFQREVIEKFTNWVTPPPNKKKAANRNSLQNSETNIKPRAVKREKGVAKSEDEIQDTAKQETTNPNSKKRKRNRSPESFEADLSGDDQIKSVSSRKRAGLGLKTRSSTTEILEISGHEDEESAYIPRGTRSRPIHLD